MYIYIIMRFRFPVYLVDWEGIEIYFKMLLKRVGSSCSERDRDLPHQCSPPHYHKLQWIHRGRQPESLLCYRNDSASTLVTLSSREHCNHAAAHREAPRHCCTHTLKPIISSGWFIFLQLLKAVTLSQTFVTAHLCSSGVLLMLLHRGSSIDM